MARTPKHLRKLAGKLFAWRWRRERRDPDWDKRTNPMYLRQCKFCRTAKYARTLVNTRWYF